MAGEAYLERLSRQLRIEIEMIQRTSVVLNRYPRTNIVQTSKPYLHESWLDLVQSL